MVGKGVTDSGYASITQWFCFRMFKRQSQKKINLMALIRTLTISTTTFERTKAKFSGFRKTVFAIKIVREWAFRRICTGCPRKIAIFLTDLNSGFNALILSEIAYFMLLTLWWFQISPQVPGWSTSVTRLYSREAWEVFQEILWQISGSHWEIPEVSQRNGEWFISRIIFIWHETGI